MKAKFKLAFLEGELEVKENELDKEINIPLDLGKVELDGETRVVFGAPYFIFKGNGKGEFRLKKVTDENNTIEVKYNG